MSTNQLGLTKKDYVGAKSTLCTGCGHDSVTNAIITAYFQSGIKPHTVAKLSGIGCSSKTPTYFMNQAHGFNSIHGRMAPLATGVKIANQSLNVIGISGDGDTASIGLGGFTHLVRRNLPMVYIVENNGVYGLTKGQFSATADKESTLKSGEGNDFEAIDISSLAIELGCGFVARSFSGDAKQLVPILDAAMRHPGTSVIDIISPCITFANHEGSTRSYNYVKEHKKALQDIGFFQPEEEIEADYIEGDTQTIEMHDGSHLTLKKIDSKEHDVSDGLNAMKLIREARINGEVLTGLFYHDPQKANINQSLNLCEQPLTELQEDIRPSQQDLADILSNYN